MAEIRLALRIPHLLLTVAAASSQTPAADEFTRSIRPPLVENCSACHNPNNPRNHLNFLKAASSSDVDQERSLWRNVASQLRNRTMPPADSKLSEDDRLRIATWVDGQLCKTLCNNADVAGVVAIRCLNGREDHNTIHAPLALDVQVNVV